MTSLGKQGIEVMDSDGDARVRDTVTFSGGASETSIEECTKPEVSDSSRFFQLMQSHRGPA